ncbi:mechanosensitive ion channel family protein [Thermodesulfobacteriota bacterium]
MMFDKAIYGSVTIFDAIIAAGVLFVSLIAARMITLYVKRYFREKVDRDHLEIIVKIIRYGILTVAAVWVMTLLGVNPSGLLVAGGVAGIVIGFASQSIVGNLISGIFLMIERPIKIGEAVRIGDVSGYVEDINIISTNIRKYDGLYVRIPNESVFTSSITNLVAHAARRFEYIVGIRYSDDADKAVEIIKTFLSDEAFVLKDPEPLVFVDELGNNSVNIAVRPWAPVSEWYSMKMKLLWKIKRTLEEQGIEIAFPQRVVWFGDQKRAEEIATSEARQRSSD